MVANGIPYPLNQGSSMLMSSLVLTLDYPISVNIFLKNELVIFQSLGGVRFTVMRGIFLGSAYEGVRRI